MIRGRSDARVAQLSRASSIRVIEPEELVGEIGPGAVLPPELLSVEGLGLALTPEQLALLSREEVSSFLQSGMRFEAMSMAAFGFTIAGAPDLTNGDLEYLLHEVGEETRHSRVFSRVLRQLGPVARNPLDRPAVHLFQQVGTMFAANLPAVMIVVVWAGEEVTDTVQQRTSEHPATDPFLRAVNRYHRQEEARHIAFAKVLAPELLGAAGGFQRFVIRSVLPGVIATTSSMLVHPGVYRTVGLPGWRTWWRAVRTPAARSIRQHSLRRVVDALVQADVLDADRLPAGWRLLAGVTRTNQPRRDG